MEIRIPDKGAQENTKWSIYRALMRDLHPECNPQTTQQRFYFFETCTLARKFSAGKLLFHWEIHLVVQPSWEFCLNLFDAQLQPKTSKNLDEPCGKSAAWVVCGVRKPLIMGPELPCQSYPWANYSDLGRGHPKWWFSKEIPRKCL